MELALRVQQLESMMMKITHSCVCFRDFQSNQTGPNGFGPISDTVDHKPESSSSYIGADKTNATITSDQSVPYRPSVGSEEGTVLLDGTRGLMYG
jgi:hypothetical protein